LGSFISTESERGSKFEREIKFYIGTPHHFFNLGLNLLDLYFPHIPREVPSIVRLEVEVVDVAELGVGK
jgi:hypothetical protein